MQDKEFELKKLCDLLDLNHYDFGTPYAFFNKESKKNIDKKIEVLTKLLNGDELTPDEYYSREVFENYPENCKGIIIN